MNRELKLENTNSKLLISETFVSRQGEGRLTGTESFFIRTSGCNLRCWFCDTPYASWHPEGSRQSIDSLVQAATHAAGSDQQPIRHVVLTGGEPLVAPAVVELAGALQGHHLHLTIETAGTVDVDVAPDLLSLSPKLSGSGPDKNQHPGWAERHEARRLPIEIMRRLLSQSVTQQVKFVVDRREELAEILGVVDLLKVDADQVYIMPQAVTIEQLDQQQQWLAPWAQSNDFQYCDRMQIRWYGNRRGT